MVAWDGVVIGTALNVVAKRIPSRASRSRFGVSIWVLP
jgi:hypothetical protein